MPQPSPEQKAALRTRFRAVLRELARDQWESESIELCARLVGQSAWQNARSVMLFVPRSDEPNIRALLPAALNAGKLTALPRFNSATTHYEAALVRDLEKDLREGQFGILEPTPACESVSLKRLDLVLVPGLAFDSHGHRLGRGKGFYDRLLAEVTGLTCGVAFEQQLVSSIPVEPHDVHLNCIITPSRWLEF